MGPRDAGKGFGVPSLNAAELARRQFREIARVAGLIFQGYPGANKSPAGCFTTYSPATTRTTSCLIQAHREVLERQLERSRLGRTLERIAGGRVTISEVERPTPLAFGLLVDQAREPVSSEKSLDRVRRLAAPLERAANTGNGRIRFGRGSGRGFR